MEKNLFYYKEIKHESGSRELIMTESENQEVFGLIETKLSNTENLEPAEKLCLNSFLADYKTLYQAYTTILEKQRIGKEDDRTIISSLPFISQLLTLDCSETKAIYFLSRLLDPENMEEEERNRVQNWLNSFQYMYQQYTDLAGMQK